MHEIIHSIKPSIFNLRIIGSKINVKKHKQCIRGKLDALAWSGIHVGYAADDYHIYQMIRKYIKIFHFYERYKSISKSECNSRT